jgi:hypothetical protein
MMLCCQSRGIRGRIAGGGLGCGVAISGNETRPRVRLVAVQLTQNCTVPKQSHDPH